MSIVKKSATPEMICDLFSIPVGTLANMRSQRKGPRYFKRGRRVTYFIEDVEAWLRSQPVQTIDSAAKTSAAFGHR
jgi:hypothetical protein